jgi:hypothetical protein
MLTIEKERETHRKGLGKVVTMVSNVSELGKAPWDYKMYTFAKNGERKIDKAK